MLQPVGKQSLTYELEWSLGQPMLRTTLVVVALMFIVIQPTGSNFLHLGFVKQLKLWIGYALMILFWVTPYSYTSHMLGDSGEEDGQTVECL